MSSDGPVPRDLDRECRSLCRYLASVEPPDYVLKKYARAHELQIVRPPRGETRFDRLLVGIARRGPLAARLADAYASLFLRRGLLRRKLVLLLAILESASPTSQAVDTVRPGSSLMFIAVAAVRAGLFVVTALACGLVLGPVHLALRVTEPSADEKAART